MARASGETGVCRSARTTGVRRGPARQVTSGGPPLRVSEPGGAAPRRLRPATPASANSQRRPIFSSVVSQWLLFATVSSVAGFATRSVSPAARDMHTGIRPFCVCALRVPFSYVQQARAYVLEVPPSGRNSEFLPQGGTRGRNCRAASPALGSMGCAMLGSGCGELATARRRGLVRRRNSCPPSSPPPGDLGWWWLWVCGVRIRDSSFWRHPTRGTRRLVGGPSGVSLNATPVVGPRPATATCGGGPPDFILYATPVSDPRCPKSLSNH